MYSIPRNAINFSEITPFGEMDTLSPPGPRTLVKRKAWGGFWRALHPKTREIPKSAKFHEFRGFQEFQRVLQEVTFFCENVALAAARPPKTTNKQQVIHGFERRARRGRRFRAKGGKTRTFHEIAEVS